MKARLLFWPTAMSYLAVLLTEITKRSYEPISVPVSGAMMGAVIGIIIGLAFFGRARRKAHRQRWQELLR